MEALIPLQNSARNGIQMKIDNNSKNWKKKNNHKAIETNVYNKYYFDITIMKQQGNTWNEHVFRVILNFIFQENRMDWMEHWSKLTKFNTNKNGKFCV